MYEIYSDDEDPTQRFVLILMDEIDAHLHPGWQQTLVSNLSKVFPKAQFIATTHSPLIVGGMPPEQVFRFARNEEGKVVQLNVEQEMTVGRADQILTGELFGLKTTLALNEETRDDLNDYKELLGKTHRTSKEEDRFQELRRRLHSSMPMSGETRSERRQQTRERETLLREVQAAMSESQSRGNELLSEEEERRLHNDARRFARLLVSEIKLYNEEKVKEGRNKSDLYDRLREDIDLSREKYDSFNNRIGSVLRLFFPGIPLRSKVACETIPLLPLHNMYYQTRLQYGAVRQDRGLLQTFREVPCPRVKAMSLC